MAFNGNQEQLLCESIILGVLVVLAVIGRLYLRRAISKTFALDDYFVVASAVFFWVYNSSTLNAIVHGRTGVDPMTLSYEQLEVLLKETYIGIMMLLVCITTARFSIIALFYRLFSVDRHFALALKIISAVSVVWYLATSFVVSFRCMPVSALWDPLHSGTCISLQTIFLVTESMNCLLDVALVILPIMLIRRLSLPVRDKLGLCFVFSVGSLVCVASIVRIKFVYNPADPIFAMTQSAFWTTMQLGLGVICACLPIYRALFPTLAARYKTQVSHDDKLNVSGSAISHSSRSGGPHLRSSQHGRWYGKDSVDLLQESQALTEITSSRCSADKSLYQGKILVHTALEIV